MFKLVAQEALIDSMRAKSAELKDTLLLSKRVAYQIYNF